MAKLLVSCATLSFGGAERVLSILSKPFSDLFESVHYVLWEGGESSYPIDSRVRIISLPSISGKHGRFHQLSAFRSIVRRERPDLVLSFLTPYNMLVLASTIGLKQKIIVAERTDPKRILTGGKVTLWIRDLLYHRANSILTQTDYAKAYFDKQFKGKTTVIYNPISMDISLVGKAITCAKEHRFVTAGRLEPVKDQAMMIDAFAKFHKTNPDYRLIVYGDGPLREELQVRIDKLGMHGTIELAGCTNELWDRLLSAEAFLLTSEYEGMSNAMIEALCLGLPVISTRVSGAIDLIQDGENGYLVDVKDVDALSDRMCLLANNPRLRQRMGEKAAGIYDLLREDRISKQWIEYLKTMII